MSGKKVLFVSGSLNRGGAQRVLCLLANKYAQLGWDVHLCVLLDNKAGYAIDNQIVIHDLVSKGNIVSCIYKWIRGIRRILKEEQPNVVVSFVGRVNILTLIAAEGMNIPILVSERNDPANDRRGKFEQWLCKYYYGKADKVVFQTEYQSNIYRKRCYKNGVVIGNPISAPVYDGVHPRKDIICVGKLMDQKNHTMMINAFSMITDEFPEKQVFIFGDGAKKRELEDLIHSLGLEHKIHLLGNSDKIFSIMREYEYFVMCSDYEGLSNALLEALISGMVCITTDWNGVEEIISDGVNGYLVPKGDIIALSEKLRCVFNKDNRIIQTNGIEKGREFTSETILLRWCQEIDSLIV